MGYLLHPTPCPLPVACSRSSGTRQATQVRAATGPRSELEQVMESYSWQRCPQLGQWLPQL